MNVSWISIALGSYVFAVFSKGLPMSFHTVFLDISSPKNS